MAMPLRPQSAESADPPQAPEDWGDGFKTKIDRLVTEWDSWLSNEADWNDLTRRSAKIREVFVMSVWGQLESDYKEMLDALLPHIRRRLEEKKLSANVFGRVKEAGSIAKTLERREQGTSTKMLYGSFRDVFREMHDLVGFRIVLRTQDQQSQGVEFVETEFGHLKEPAHISPHRKSSKLWHARVGTYESNNLRVGIDSPGVASPNVLSRFCGIMFEIQVTYWSKMALNIIEHPMPYKGEFGELPRPIEGLMDIVGGSITMFGPTLQLFSEALKVTMEEKAVATARGTAQERRELRVAKEAAYDGVEKMGSDLRHSIQNHIEDYIEDLAGAMPLTDAPIGSKAKFWRDESEKQTVEIQELVQEIQRQREERLRERRTAVLQKLRGASSYRSGKERIPPRLPGTCEWFTNHECYKAWLGCSTSSLLWVSAGAGCGKSVLAKHLVDTMLPQTSPGVVCYFFFKDDFEDQRDAHFALCSILHQIFDKAPTLLTEEILQRFESMGDGLLASYRGLWYRLMEVAAQKGTLEIVCVLDGLDECLGGGRALIAESLRRFYGPTHADDSHQQHPASSCRLKFLLTSRPDVDLQRELQFLADSSPVNTEGNRHLSIHLQGDGTAESCLIAAEIEKVVQSKVKDLGEALHLRPEQEEMVLEALARAPNRTYLWVHLMCDHLSKWDDVMFPGALERELATMPVTVAEVYDKILNNLNSDHTASQTIRVLQIVYAAIRPLTIEELGAAWTASYLPRNPLDAFAFFPLGDDPIDFLGYYRIEDLKSVPEGQVRTKLGKLCGSLITVVDRRVYFLHQTVREFLVDIEVIRAAFERVDASNMISDESENDSPENSQHEERCPVIASSTPRRTWKSSLNPVKAHKRLGKICIRYLTSIAWDIRFFRRDKDAVQIQATYKFFNYCMQSVFVHNAQFNVPRRYERSIRYLCFDYPDFWDMMAIEPGSFNEACKHGNEATVSAFLDDGYDATKYRGTGLPAIAAAAWGGHAGTVRLLLAIDGIDVDARSWKGWTALFFAAHAGHDQVVRILLETGKVDVDAKDGSSRTPLSYAATGGFESVVRLLLDSGTIDVDAKDRSSRTPLSYAAKGGSESVVRLLLDSGTVDVNAKDKSSRTPLSYAAEGGFEPVVKALLDSGKIDGDHVDAHGRTELYHAAALPSDSVFQMLVASGQFNVNHRSYDGFTPLLRAALYGNSDVVKRLIGTGKAELDARRYDKYGYITPLARAAAGCHADIFEQLLNAGADPDVQGSEVPGVDRSIDHYVRGCNISFWSPATFTRVEVEEARQRMLRSLDEARQKKLDTRKRSNAQEMSDTRKRHKMS
ncbi:hypothetical protein RB595_007486 [Gaeumannomyces hyphopodioides]